MFAGIREQNPSKSKKKSHDFEGQLYSVMHYW